MSAVISSHTVPACCLKTGCGFVISSTVSQRLIFIYRAFTIETEGKSFKLTKDMVSVKRFQKTLHGEIHSRDIRVLCIEFGLFNILGLCWKVFTWILCLQSRNQSLYEDDFYRKHFLSVSVAHSGGSCPQCNRALLWHR